MKKCLLLGICLIGFSIYADGETAPTRFDAYNGMVPDARAIAMGESFVAVGNTPSMAVYNPAGLAGITANLFSITLEATRQSELTTDQIFSGEALRNRSVQFLALTGPKGSLSWRPVSNETTKTMNGVDWIENEVKISALTIAAAQQNSPSAATGLSLSYLTGTIAQSSLTGGVPFMNLADGSGASADFGFLWTISPQLRAGLNLNNIFGMMWWDDYGSEQLPFSIRAGFSFQVADFLIFSSDWEKRYYRKDPDTNIGRTPEIIHFGIEQWLGKILALRAGTFSTDLNNKEAVHVTAGLGYSSAGYALSLAGEKYRVSQADVYRYVFSLDAPFGTTTSDQTNAQ
ncbi:MAG: hypothetical protein NTU66_02545 [Elusimicrobia bacterium]|nr:hypothetical protein [Elusimicrobiota bacterium]